MTQPNDQQPLPPYAGPEPAGNAQTSQSDQFGAGYPNPGYPSSAYPDQGQTHPDQGQTAPAASPIPSYGQPEPSFDASYGSAAPTQSPSYGSPASAPSPATSAVPAYGAPTPAPAYGVPDPIAAYDSPAPTYGESPAAAPAYGSSPAAPASSPVYGTPAPAYGSPTPGAPAAAPYGQPIYGHPAPNAATSNPTGVYAAPPSYHGYAAPTNDPSWTDEPPLNQPYYGISFGGAIVRFFKKYATFSGRASRSEFWWVYLFMCIVNGGLIFLSSAFSSANAGDTGSVVGLDVAFFFGSVFNILEFIWWIATIVPSIAIYVRRLHDANKPGTLILVPYALCAAGIMAIPVTVGGSFAGFAGSMASADQLGGAIAVMIGGILASIALFLAGFIVWLVFAVKGSDPQGARFDR